MINVLLIGPLPEPTTGVSLANQVVVDNLGKTDSYKLDYINTSFNKFDEKLGAFSLVKLLFYLKLNLYAYKVFGAKIVYITPGQTFFGVLKYVLFIFLSKISNKELIIHVHGNHLGKEYELLTGIKKAIFKFLLKQTSKGIVLSESLTGNMSNFISQDKIHVVYNFVQDYLFVEKNTIIQKTKNLKPKIFFLSNLMKEKGIFDLLEALYILEEEGFEYEAKIAGHIDNMHQEKVLEYFKKLKHTKYCGVVSGESKKDLLLWGNVFVLPTYYTMEGQPISILEAMATGNLVITTKHAGIPDIFEDKINGFYVEKMNAKNLAETIKMVVSLNEKQTIIMENNYLYAKEKYRVSNFINAISNVFNS